MNEELIKRILWCESFVRNDVVLKTLRDCHTELARLSESLKESRETSLHLAQARETLDAENEMLRNALLLSDEQCDEILSNIDDLARDVDAYDYGLPMIMEHSRKLMREAIRNGVKK